MKPKKNWMFKELDKFKLFNKSETYPKNKISEKEAYELAEFMHNVYEKASQQVNWKTQKKCRVDFNKLPFENRRVMMIVSNMILSVIYRDCKKLKED